MPKGSYLGEFEQIVLLALSRLGDDAYGMTIRREIEAVSGRSVSIGAVYATLERLRAKRYVDSERSEPSAVLGGRSKRCYRLRREGARALKRTKELFERMWNGVEAEVLSKSR
jgi:DNA-binding PadR family transcriptional regulator